MHATPSTYPKQCSPLSITPALCLPRLNACASPPLSQTCLSSYDSHSWVLDPRWCGLEGAVSGLQTRESRPAAAERVKAVVWRAEEADVALAAVACSCALPFEEASAVRALAFALSSPSRHILSSGPWATLQRLPHTHSIRTSKTPLLAFLFHDAAPVWLGLVVCGVGHCVRRVRKGVHE